MNALDGILTELRDIARRLSRLEVQEYGSTKIQFTRWGGVMIQVVAGEALAEGEVVYIKIISGTDGRVWKNPVSGDMPIGVVYADALVNANVWVVVDGIAYVLPEAAVTAARGNYIYASAATAGRVAQSATVPATTNTAVGHFLDTGSGAGVKTRAVLHFN